LRINFKIRPIHLIFHSIMKINPVSFIADGIFLLKIKLFFWYKVRTLKLFSHHADWMH